MASTKLITIRLPSEIVDRIQALTPDTVGLWIRDLTIRTVLAPPKPVQVFEPAISGMTKLDADGNPIWDE